MEMNFPHKSLAPAADSSDGDTAVLAGEHHALIAHAIARQALSHSARAFVAYQSGEGIAINGNRPSRLEDRIHFFAGKAATNIQSDESGRKPVRGHFRPDLAGEKQSGETARPNYERAVYLGNLGN